MGLAGYFVAYNMGRSSGGGSGQRAGLAVLIALVIFVPFYAVAYIVRRFFEIGNAFTTAYVTEIPAAFFVLGLVAGVTFALAGRDDPPELDEYWLGLWIGVAGLAVFLVSYGVAWFFIEGERIPVVWVIGGLLADVGILIGVLGLFLAVAASVYLSAAPFAWLTLTPASVTAGLSWWWFAIFAPNRIPFPDILPVFGPMDVAIFICYGALILQCGLTVAAAAVLPDRVAGIAT